MVTYLLLAFIGFSAGFIAMTLACGASNTQLKISIVLGLLSLLALLHFT